MSSADAQGAQEEREATEDAWARPPGAQEWQGAPDGSRQEPVDGGQVRSDSGCPAPEAPACDDLVGAGLAEAAAGAVPDAGEPVSEDESPEVAVLVRERDDYLDALRRLQAEFENYRKRVLKQQVEQTERAAEGLVAKLLPVLDTLDLAMAHLGGAPGEAQAGSGGASAAEASALAQVAGALGDTLGKEGLERIEPIGAPFDPREHEAVMHEAGDGAPPEVVEVLRSGWRWRGRVLRAALVRVKG